MSILDYDLLALPFVNAIHIKYVNLFKVLFTFKKKYRCIKKRP